MDVGFQFRVRAPGLGRQLLVDVEVASTRFCRDV